MTRMASLTYMQMGIGKIARHFTSLSLHRTVDSLSLSLSRRAEATNLYLRWWGYGREKKWRGEEKKEEDTFPYYYTKEE